MIPELATMPSFGAYSSHKKQRTKVEAKSEAAFAAVLLQRIALAVLVLLCHILLAVSPRLRRCLRALYGTITCAPTGHIRQRSRTVSRKRARR